jgi:hypothetical protein
LQQIDRQTPLTRHAAIWREIEFGFHPASLCAALFMASTASPASPNRPSECARGRYFFPQYRMQILYSLLQASAV